MRFCEECGAPQTASVEAPPAAVKTETRGEERRLVTALFCDLVGFTPLSEHLDAEEVRDIQAAYFDGAEVRRGCSRRILRCTDRS